LASKSKIPPELCSAVLDVLQALGDEIDLFGFHGSPLKSVDYTT
jgi:hypothetical protein